MKLSALNLVPIREGQNAQDAIASHIKLAQHLEKIGIERMWIAEHHNMQNLASSSTQLLIMHTLANTQTLKVGSGGVMLPNHSPYVVAEQYGTLATIFPGRVELGLGRAPGTDGLTAFALRKGRKHGDFRQEIAELRSYFDGTAEVNAYPAKNVAVPFYILGSSTESAYLAAELGLPYAFASHFAPAMLVDAVNIYRQHFKPSQYLAKPYVIVGVNAIVADSDEEAESLATTQSQFYLNVVTNAQNKLQPPAKSDDALWDEIISSNRSIHFGPVDISELSQHNSYRRLVDKMTGYTLKGTKESVKAQLHALQTKVEFDEIIAQSFIFDEGKQAYSYTLLKEVVEEMG
ncbi:LLM class flavin-dependent oxidoreductase [Moraxella sp. ZJ142]|uniref:LLM class flavin-dependent oxidoreductase n=2 Tax=Moraxella marmotae TaxID=3344520 RepID=UPI0035D46ACC